MAQTQQGTSSDDQEAGVSYDNEGVSPPSPRAGVVVVVGGKHRGAAGGATRVLNINHLAATMWLLPCVCYAASSVCTTLLNKAVIRQVEPKYSLFLLVSQHIATVCITLALHCLKVIPPLFSDVDHSIVIKWIPLDVLFVLMLLTNTAALKFVSIPIVTVFKAFSTVVTALGDYFLFNQRLSIGIVGSLVLMVVSSVIAGLNDLEYNGWGYFWMTLNCISTSCYALYMRLAMKTKVPEFTAAFLNNAIAIPLLFPVLLMSGTLEQSLMHTLSGGGLFRMIFCMSCVSGFFVCCSAFWCVRRTSPTTYSMVGALNKIPLTILGWILFGASMTWLGVTSVCVGLSAGVWYTMERNIKKDLHPEINSRSILPRIL
ncbi:GDP-mannose transporter [Pelomyxa schiedti]|nr:GDP-mannose transporter [Pelomyxa schiedti]